MSIALVFFVLLSQMSSMTQSSSVNTISDKEIKEEKKETEKLEPVTILCANSACSSVIQSLKRVACHYCSFDVHLFYCPKCIWHCCYCGDNFCLKEHREGHSCRNMPDENGYVW